MQKRILLLFIISIGFPFTGQSQEKLPQVQKNSIWMNGFEADGKLDEWQQLLQAYNEDTHIAYSLANDDAYLYLAVKSNRTAKIFNGGIGLKIKQSNKADLEVIYPYNFAHDWAKKGGLLRILNDPKNPKSLKDLDQIETRSMINNADSIIPMVNEYGLLAGISEVMGESEIYENGERHYIVEIAVPLLYLDVNNEEIEYTIQLRGIKVDIPVGNKIMMPVERGAQTDRELNYEKIKAQDTIIPAELKGTYRLAPENSISIK